MTGARSAPERPSRRASASSRVKNLSPSGRIDIRYAIENGIHPALIESAFPGVRPLGHPDASGRKKRLRFGAGFSAGTMVIPVRFFSHARKSPRATGRLPSANHGERNESGAEAGPAPVRRKRKRRISSSLKGSSRRRRARGNPCLRGFSGEAPRRETPCPPPLRCSSGSPCCGAGARGKAHGRETSSPWC